jgi:hypothetical protein
MNANKRQLHQELKRNFVLERLLELGIKKAQSGKNIHDCDYRELKSELAVASFRDIDAQSDSAKWF